MKPDIMVPEAPRVVLPLVTSSNIKLELDKKKELVTTQLRNTVSDLSLAADDLIIPWNELILKEKIGAGTRKFSLFQSGGNNSIFFLNRTTLSTVLAILVFNQI